MAAVYSVGYFAQLVMCFVVGLGFVVVVVVEIEVEVEVEVGLAQFLSELVLLLCLVARELQPLAEFPRHSMTSLPKYLTLFNRTTH